MYTYIHIHLYACMYIYIYMYTFIFIGTSVRMHTKFVEISHCVGLFGGSLCICIGFF